MSKDSECSGSDPPPVVNLIRLEIDLIRAYLHAALEAERRGDQDSAAEAWSRGASLYSRVKQLLAQVPAEDRPALVASLRVLHSRIPALVSAPDGIV
jgi:hypothetical protein